MAATTVVARLKPYNPKRGYKLRTCMVRGVKFVQDKWYQVPADLGPVLEEILQDQTDEDSLPAFDVVKTSAEAQKIVRQEQERKARQEARAEAPKVVNISGGDLTTDDLPRVSTERTKARARAGAGGRRRARRG